MSTGVSAVPTGESLTSPADHADATDDLLTSLPRTPRVHHLVAVVTYLVVAVILWAHVWLGGSPAHAITCNCGDTVQQVWWFQWLPWALAHGHNPFLSNTLWARFGGVNVLSNTSWLFPSAVLAPITVWFGPVASFNLANLLAPVLSGWAAFALAGRVSRRLLSRVLAGAVYAFSPFVLRNTVLGHLDLTLTAFLPLTLLVGLRLLTRGARPVRLGLLLGVMVILEFFTSYEVLALTAITGGLFAIGALLTRPRLVRAAGHVLGVAAASGAALVAVVLAYPVWFFLDGPRHVAGPFWKVGSTNPIDLVYAGAGTFSPNAHLASVGYLGNRGPNTAYLGAGIVLLLLVSIPVWRRRPFCQVAAGVLLVCWCLEFCPAVIWAHLPLLDSIVLVRFALPLSLCAGLLLAASLDGWWAWVRHRWPTARDATRRHVAEGVVVVAIALALVPTISDYTVPFTVTTATVPAWFRAEGPHLLAGTVVLTFPFAYGVGSQAMGWQAESRDDFDLIGGWVFIPGGNGHSDQGLSPLGEPIPSIKALNQHPDQLTVAQQRVLRAAALRWRPFDIVVVPGYANPATACALAVTLGIAPAFVHGSWVWRLTPTTRLGPLRPVPHTDASAPPAATLPEPCRAATSA